LGALANILNNAKTKYKHHIKQIEELIVPLVDAGGEIEEHAIRIISNNIGFSSDWIENQYKPSIGLDKI
jgi:hypothetical protein